MDMNFTKEEVLTGLFVYCLDNEEFAAAEKVADEYLLEFPDAYEAHHMKHLIKLIRGLYTEDVAYLLEMKSQYGNSEIYWKDVLESAGQAYSLEELLDFLESEEGCREYAGIAYYAYKISVLLNLGRYDEYHAASEELAERVQFEDPRVQKLIDMVKENEYEDAIEYSIELLEQLDADDPNKELVEQMQNILAFYSLDDDEKQALIAETMKTGQIN